MQKSRSIVLIGHRGAMGHETQNTLAAINKGFDLGATWVEIDISFLDNELYLFHDRRLERIANTDGLFSELTTAKLKSLRLTGGHPIPTLKEVLEVVRVRGGIDIEIKGDGCVPALCSTLIQYEKSGGDLSKIIVKSYDHTQVALFRQTIKNVKCGALFYGTVINEKEYLSKIQPHSVHYSIEFVTKEQIAACKAWGYRTVVYTVNHKDDVLRLIDWGVDGIISDYPDVVLSTLQEAGVLCGTHFL